MFIIFMGKEFFGSICKFFVDLKLVEAQFDRSLVFLSTFLNLSSFLSYSSKSVISFLGNTASVMYPTLSPINSEKFISL